VYADQDRKLVPVDEELRGVAEIKDMREAGKTLRKIAADLKDRGQAGRQVLRLNDQEHSQKYTQPLTATSG
jgi:hypothetical protein